jgi:hypothetical protein
MPPFSNTARRGAPASREGNREVVVAVSTGVGKESLVPGTGVG